MNNWCESVEDHGEAVLDQLTIVRLKQELSEEEWEIWYMWAVEELTFAEIGKIIGLKYRGKELTGSAIRYHRDKIQEKLLKFREMV